MLTRPRAAWAVLAVAASAVAAWAAVGAYRARGDAEHALARGWRPNAAALARAGEGRVASAVAALAEPTELPATRLDHYRHELQAAWRLYAASVRARPADALSWARLAAVSWELDEDGGARASRLAQHAERLAPNRADVRRVLAQLALDMGHTTSALAHWRSAIALEPTTVPDAIAALSRRGFAPDTIAAVVPHEPRHLVALARIYFSEGREHDYIALVAPVLVSTPDVALLASWADAHRRLGEWSRLERALAAPALDRALPLAVQLRLERSRVLTALGRKAEALDEAEAALALDPSSAVAAELVGGAGLAAGDAARAVEGFREALELAARAAAAPDVRARLYRGIGRAEESRGRVEPAWDAYQRAQALDPDDPLVRARLLALERAAR